MDDASFRGPAADGSPGRAAAAPWLLLLVAASASPTQALLAQLHVALRAVEPRAWVVVRAEPTRQGACAYRLRGHWTRPMAAHAALVLVFSGLAAEPRVPHP